MTSEDKKNTVGSNEGEGEVNLSDSEESTVKEKTQCSQNRFCVGKKLFTFGLLALGLGGGYYFFRKRK